MPQQVSVFAENRPGKIERVTRVLMEKGINLRAITIADAGDYGIIKMLMDRPEEGCEALAAAGIAATLKGIVAVRIPDSPGGLHGAAAVLSQQGVNVEDAYGFVMHGSDSAVFVFQVGDVPKTEKILAAAGFSVLTDRELYLL